LIIKDHYGFDEATLEPFFAQADENEDGQLDAVEFAGFRSVIRARAVKNALGILPDVDEVGTCFSTLSNNTNNTTLGRGRTR